MNENESQNVEELDTKMEAAKSELPYTFAGKQRTDPEIPVVFRWFITSVCLCPVGSDIFLFIHEVLLYSCLLLFQEWPVTTV